MRLLITGWQGQVARALAGASAASPEVTGLAIGRPALDLCKLPTILRTLSDTRPDVIINTAAYTAVDKAEAEPDAAEALNRDGARYLAEAAAQRDIPLIHLSTDYVFDGRSSEPYREADATGPLNVYGRSKLAGEEAIRAIHPRHLILRTAWVHSPYGQNFVKTMLRLAGERPKLKVVDDQLGTPTYAPHLASAILTAASRISGERRESPLWGLYHLAGTGETTWCGLAREVMARAAELGVPAVEVEPIASADYPTPAARPMNSRLDSGLFASRFGTRLPEWQRGVAEGVALLVAESRAGKA